MSTLDRILAEQRAAAARVMANHEDRLARLWLADWVAEELLYRIAGGGGVSDRGE